MASWWPSRAVSLDLWCLWFICIKTSCWSSSDAAFLLFPSQVVHFPLITLTPSYLLTKNDILSGGLTKDICFTGSPKRSSNLTHFFPRKMLFQKFLLAAKISNFNFCLPLKTIINHLHFISSSLFPTNNNYFTNVFQKLPIICNLKQFFGPISV